MVRQTIKPHELTIAHNFTFANSFLMQRRLDFAIVEDEESNLS